jgi:DedD protein
MASSETRDTAPDAQSDLKRKLLARIGVAGVMIALLLGTLAVFDRINAPEETEDEEPRFTAPVPVAKKEMTQPLTPAGADGPNPADAAAAPAEAETSAAPVDRTVAPEATGTPPPPSVAATPGLPAPREGSRGAGAPAPAATPPASGVAGAGSAPPAALPAPPAAVAASPSPRADSAPLRPGTGYALQAGVFADTRRAEELHALLTLNGIPSTIESRVQVGPFRTRQEAEAARARMQALGVEALLLPPKGGARR